MFLGDLDHDGTASAEEARELGFDLDGIDTQSDLASGCRQRLARRFVDGRCGIDDVFGVRMTPLFVASAEQLTLSSIGRGSLPAPLLRLRGLAATGDDASVSLAWFLSDVEGEPASTNGSWLVGSEWVSGGDLQAPTTPITNGYVSGDTLVVAPVAPLPLALGMEEPRWMLLTVHHPVLALVLAPDRRSATGVIAGVLAVDELVEAAFEGLRGRLGEEPCGHANAVALYDEMVDTRLDGSTEGDCDAVSFAIGVEATAVAIAGVGPKPGPFVGCSGWVQ